MNPVALPPGWAKLSTIPAPTGSATDANTMGSVRLIFCNAVTARVPLAKMMSRAERDQSRSLFYSLVGVVLGPASVDPHIAANIPAQFLQALVECCKSILTFRVVGSPVHEDTDPPKTF